MNWRNCGGIEGRERAFGGGVSSVGGA
jgi:hypothetical protein